MKNKKVVLSLIILAILLIAGCIQKTTAEEKKTIILVKDTDPFDNSLNHVYVIHDEEYRVTCWVLSGNGISCLPDSKINKE